MSRRVALIVLDGVGIGAAHDAGQYGDTDSNTLAHVLRTAGQQRFGNLEALGLGCCAPIPAIACVKAPLAAFGVAEPSGAGKDSTTGHWELSGVVLDRPFPTYPDGFPSSVIDDFASQTGRGVLCNRAASGTAVLDEYGEEHLRTGDWIVYTSADSVFQVAAHEEVVPTAELYRACEVARQILTPPHGVSRVIARPFTGQPGAFTRTSARRDLSVPPPEGTLLQRLSERGVPIRGVGKVDDLFAGRYVTSEHVASNAEAYGAIARALRTMDEGLLFANVIDFDQLWGHRNDVPGFLRGLVELDKAVPVLLSALREDDFIIFTADHGNDPTTASTDHARERVPLLVAGPPIRPVPLGVRRSFADVGQTIAAYFGTAPLAHGRSFLSEVLG